MSFLNMFSKLCHKKTKKPTSTTKYTLNYYSWNFRETSNVQLFQQTLEMTIKLAYYSDIFYLINCLLNLSLIGRIQFVAFREALYTVLLNKK